MTTSNITINTATKTSTSSNKIVKVGNTIFIKVPKRNFFGGLSSSQFTYIKA